MNNNIWYHHPVVIVQTIIWAIITFLMSILIAISFDSWISILLGILISTIMIVSHLLWLRERSLAITGKGRVLIKEPFRLSSKTYNPFTAQIDYDQSLLGRILDYGDVVFHLHGKDLRFCKIGPFRDLQSGLEDERYRAANETQRLPVINIFVAPTGRVNRLPDGILRTNPRRDPNIINGHFVDGEDGQAR